MSGQRQRGSGSARRLGRRVRTRYRPGRDPVRIDDLVSPLRYDILIRQRFFEMVLEAERDEGADPAEMAATPAWEAYFQWFSTIAVPRYQPELLGDEAAVEGAFRRRVRTAMALCHRFMARGYDPEEQPITLLTGRQIEPTATGKLLDRPLYAGDGCHRLALLRMGGATTLEAGTYRVRVTRGLTPLDNTARLIPLLGVDPESYYRFLSLSYAPGSEATTRDALVEDARAHEPDRLAELERVLAVDEPLLDTATS